MSDESHFHQARILAPAERAKYLAAHCPDLEMRRRIEELLLAHDAAGGVLDQSVATAAFSPSIGSNEQQRTVTEKPGLDIGPYKLLQKLGEGGMGAVWAAEQSTPVKRRVALKLIKAGMDSSQVLRRFEAERQALALMDHQNIAKVLDAGATPQGRPYFAMELIKGLPITKYCDQEHLTPRERLELFIPVCQAVQHAHQKGVIHRDLKPSNVLIALYDGRPVPKIIDFGVAKAISQKLTEQTMYTEVGQIVGTLEYMAPEQAELNNLDIDTRADVYSLGVILYELLAGSPPFSAKQLRGAAFSEMLRMIREVEPPRPSTRLSSSNELPSIAANRKLDPKRLTRVVHGDLDWIVMKALEKDRGRRYETANGFAMDLQRYLVDEPVSAGPPRAAYRLRKLIRRNKGPVLAAAAVLLSLAIGTAAVITVQVRANRALKAKNDELAAKNTELEEEQAKVQARFDLAQKAIETFHTGVSEDVLVGNEQFKDLRAKLLRSAAHFYGQLEKLLAGQNDPRSRKALGDSYQKLGELVDDIGAKSEALALFRKALAVRRDLAAEADVEAQMDVVRSLRSTARVLFEMGNPSATRTAHEEATRIAEQLSQRDPTHEVQIELAKGYIGLALCLEKTGETQKAIDEYRNAESFLQKLVDADPSNTESLKQLGLAVNNLGALMYETGKPAEALGAFQRSRVIRQRLADSDPTNARLQESLAGADQNIGAVLKLTGKLTEALAAYRKGREIRKALVKSNPAVTEFQNKLAVDEYNIGVLLNEMGKPNEALPPLEQARSIQQKLVEADPNVTHHLAGLAHTHYAIGYVLKDLNKFGPALAESERCRALQQRLVDVNPNVPEFQGELASTINSIGLLQRDMDRPDEAITSCEQAIQILQKLSDAHAGVVLFNSSLAHSYSNLSLVLFRVGRTEDAMASEQKALAIRQKLADANPGISQFQVDLANSHSAIGLLLAHAGRRTDAMAPAQKALAIWEKLVQAHPTVPSFQSGLAECYNNRSDLLRMDRRDAEAREGYDRALAVGEPLAKNNPTSTLYQAAVAHSLRGRGMARFGLGDLAGAVADVRRSLATWNAIPTRTAEDWFETACCHAALAGFAAEAASGINAADAKSEAGEAVRSLQIAVRGGYRTPAYFHTKDLDPLRDRADFKALLAELNKRKNVTQRN